MNGDATFNTADITQPQPPPDQTQQPAPVKLPFTQVLDHYHQASADEPELAKLSLPQFSQKMNEVTGTNNYDEGLNDSWLRRVGAASEQGMRHFGGMLPGEKRLFGLPTPSEMFGGPPTGVDLPAVAHSGATSLAKQTGLGDNISEAVGSGIEGIVKSAPALAATFMQPELAAPILGVSGGLEKYGETGQVVPSAIAAATGFATPKLLDFGGQTALKALGAKTAGEISPELASLLPKTAAGQEALSQYSAAPGWGPTSLIQRAGRIAGAQAGLFAGGELGGVGETLTRSDLDWRQRLEELGQQFSPSGLVASAVGQLPFLPFEIFSERTHPLDALSNAVKSNFAGRYTQFAMRGDPESGSPPFVPTPEQINKVMENLTTGKVQPTSPEGKVLASMDMLPSEVDPVMTKEALVPMSEAMGETKDRVARMALAQGVPLPKGGIADQTLISEIRAAEKASEGKADKDTLITNAATGVVWKVKSDLSKLSYQGETEDQWSQYGSDAEKMEEHARVMKEITKAITPPTEDVPNPDYDQEAHQRVAITSGDPEHWHEAGIDQPIYHMVGGQETSEISNVGGTPIEVRRREKIPAIFDRSIIDQFTGLPTKPSLDAELVANRKRAADLQQAKDAGTATKDERRELVQLQKVIRQKESEFVDRQRTVRLGRLAPGGQPQSAIYGETTFEGVRRAYNYGKSPEDVDENGVQKKLDLTDPESVTRFRNDVMQKMKWAEADFARVRAGRRTLDEVYGNDDAAQTRAATAAKLMTDEAAGEEEDYIKKYYPVKDKNGNWRVSEVLQYRFKSLGEEDKPRAEAQAVKAAFEPEPGLKTLGRDPDALADNRVSDRFREIEKGYDDPAEVEARKQALSDNVTYFLDHMTDAEFEKLVLDAQRTDKYQKSVQKPAELKQKMMRYLQFMRDGGHVDVTGYVPEGGTEENRRLAGGDPRRKRGDPNTQLINLNNYMDAVGFGVGKYPVSHERAGQLRIDDWNNATKAGLNFFEQFAAVADAYRKQMPDPRAFGDAIEHRPLGDLGGVPRGFIDTFVNNLVLNWNPELSKGVFRPPGGKQMPAPTEPIVMLAKDRQGNTVRLESSIPGTTEEHAVNPLQTAFMESTKRSLTMTMSTWMDLFEKYGLLDDTNKQLMALAKKLMGGSAFLRNMPVGVSPAKRANEKAYTHTDHNESSAGMLLSPFKEVPAEPKYQAQYIRELMEPNEFFPHFMNEVGHAATDFAFSHDLEFQRAVGDIFKIVNDEVKLRKIMSAGTDEYTKIPLHALTSPREFLASMFNDVRLHKLLQSIDDPNPFPGRGVSTPYPGTLFDRFITAIRNMMTRLFNIGDPEAHTLLNRMTDLATQAYERQQNMNLFYKGDIYHQTIREQLFGGSRDLLGPPAKPPVEGIVPIVSTPGMVTSPFTPARPEDLVPPARPPTDYLAAVIRNHESRVADAQARFQSAVALGKANPQDKRITEEVRLARRAVELEAQALRALRRVAIARPEPEQPPYVVKGEPQKEPPTEPEKVWTVTPQGQVLKGPFIGPPGEVLASKVSDFLYHGTKARKVVGDHYEPITVDDLNPTVDRPLFASFDKTGAGYTRGETGRVLQFKVKGNFATPEQMGEVARRIGVSEDALIQQDRDTYRLIKALNNEGFDGVEHYDQHHETGELINAVVIWNPNAMIKQPIASGGRGEVLPSKVDGQAVLDSMKDASLYLHEDPRDRIWFRPYPGMEDYFRDTYGPAFGAGLRYEPRGDEIGYSISKNSINELTPYDLAAMPKPQVKSWAPSIFEMLRGFHQDLGSSPEVASALAAQAMRFGALLRNTDTATWGKLQSEDTRTGVLLGAGWGWKQVAGLTREAFTGARSVEASILHESAHMATETPDVRAAYQQVTDVFNALDENGRQAFLDGLATVTAQDGELPAQYDQAVTNPREFGAEYLAHVGDVITNLPKPSVYLREQMRFVSDELSNLLIKNTLRRAQGLDRYAEAVKRIAAQRGIKDVNWERLVTDAADAFKSIARPALEISTDQAEFYRMRNLYPDMYKPLLDNLAQQLVEFGKNYPMEQTPVMPGEILASKTDGPVNMIRRMFKLPTPSGELPDKLSWWDRFLTNFSQFTDKHPEANSAWDMFYHANAGFNAYRTKMAAALAGAMTGKGFVDDARTKQVNEFSKRNDLRQVFNKVALDLNTFGDTRFDKELAAAGDIMAMNPQQVTGFLTPEFMQGLLKKYGVQDKDIPTMMTVLDGTRNQIKAAGEQMVRSAYHRLDSAVAVVVARATDMMPEAARNTAKLLTDGIKLEQTDINAGMAKLAQFSQTLNNPEAFGRAYDAATALLQNIQTLERFLELRMPYFMSERRPGRYGLMWRGKDDKVTSQYFASDADRRKYITNNQITPVRQTNPGDRDWGVSSQIFKQLDEVQLRTKEKLINLFGNDEGSRLAATMDMASDLRDSLNSRDVLKATTGRDLAPGREELDMFAAHQQYVNAVGRASFNTFLRLETELVNTAPDLRNQPEIKDYINRQVKAVMLPDSPLGRWAQNTNFLYYLFANISSMIMQASHQLLGLAPQLTARGSSVADSFNTIRRANQLLIEARLKGKYVDPQIQAVIDRARQDGTLGSWISQEMDYSPDLSLINRARATMGNTATKPLWTAFDMLKNKLYTGYDLMRKMYDIVPTYNGEVALVASMLHLQKYGGAGGETLSGDQLYREAQFLRGITMFTGGKTQRPGFFQYLPRSASQGLWSLQTYANGLTTMMGELIRRSVSPPKGFTPAQTKQVRKAAAQMLFTQTAVAGVLGLPFAQAMLFGLQKLFPEHNLEEDLREALGSMFGDNEQMGNMFANSMTMGIPTSMGGVDMGSRFALAGTFHVSPYSGVGWEQLVGPTGGVLSRALEAGQAGLRGDPMTAVQELMPNGFQRIWKTLEQGKTYQTESGQQVVNDLTPEEIVARMIGFRPSRVAKMEEFQRLTKLSEDAEKAQNTRWVGDQVRLMGNNQDADVQQNLAQRVAETQGRYTAEGLANAISREYERKTMPVDPRMYGNRATVLAQKKLMGIVGTPSEGPTNVERLQLQQSIAARLGLGGPRPGSLLHAANVDQLMSMYPHLTKPQADLLLTHAAGSQPSPELYSELSGAPY